jgi:hypothetical protein
VVVNGLLRLDSEANLSGVVIIGVICRVNELMGLDEFLVLLFATVVHLGLKIESFISLDLSVFTGLTTFESSGVFASS